MWIGGTVHDLCAVQGQGPSILGVRAFIGHHDAKAPNLRIDHRPEGVQRPAVLLDPPVIDVVRTDGVLDRKERRDFIVLEDYLALRVEDEAHVKKAVGPIGMTRLSLRHDEGLILAGNFAECLCLFSRNVDGACSGELCVIEVEHLVVERLQSTFGKGDEPDRKVQAGEPGGRLDEMGQVLQVDLDISPGADAPHGGDETNSRIGFDHNGSLLLHDDGWQRL